MKKAFVIFLALFTVHHCFSQTDTISIHTFSIAQKKAGKKSYYFYNNNPSNKKVYDSISDVKKAEFQKLTECKPCYVKRYDLSNSLTNEGLFYQDCPVGTYIEYYTTWKIKTKGNYVQTKEDTTCSLKNGKFLHYSEKGVLMKEEVWDKGKLIFTK